jgi:heme/copper-type cytochrome/quinol oxidase subunit 4
MMISDFVTLVTEITNLNTTGFVLSVILSLVLGAVAHKVASGINNNIIFIVCSLLFYLFWYSSMDDSIPPMKMALTACLVVISLVGYKKLLRG